MHLLRLSVVATAFESSGKSEILRCAKACPEGEADSEAVILTAPLHMSLLSEAKNLRQHLGALINKRWFGVKTRSFAVLRMTYWYAALRGTGRGLEGDRGVQGDMEGA